MVSMMMMVVVKILFSYYVRKTTHRKCREDKRPENTGINSICRDKLQRRLERQFRNFGSNLNLCVTSCHHRTVWSLCIVSVTSCHHRTVWSLCIECHLLPSPDCMVTLHWVSSFAITGLYGHSALSVTSCHHRTVWSLCIVCHLLPSPDCMVTLYCASPLAITGLYGHYVLCVTSCHHRTVWSLCIERHLLPSPDSPMNSPLPHSHIQPSFPQRRFWWIRSLITVQRIGGSSYRNEILQPQHPPMQLLCWCATPHVRWPSRQPSGWHCCFVPCGWSEVKISVPRLTASHLLRFSDRPSMKT